MIDKSAVMHKSAQIEKDVFIGPNVIIGENVKLASGVKILANAYLEHCEIGEGTIINPFASIGTAPQDLGYKNEPTKVIVGANCLIKENVTINRAANCGDMTTTVGNKCLLMVGSHVAHNCKLEDEVILANLVTLGGHVHVGFGAFIGGMSVFHQNLRIGEMAIISGFSAARQDILPYSKGEGRPPYPAGINAIALKRRGVAQEERTAINEALKLLISPEYNTSQAIEQIEKTLKINPYVQKMIDFVRTSKRGVTLQCRKSGHRILEDE
ncbi:MAG TPA: acyl-ACP--UDP-N-acetylglucosamine O-acyltransferase [Candidatus Gastranaerophilaceae bacterium]|nr:acyl-ACP--UDP-N-acetylglucosamine O-acyltransferase [Candidatus Gastranaerophilaceae bacterium]HPT41110.1 acyl-ACP--UDP-N-acetylglucosamine O-acyltransferase [Candidatus Gastranaerophilaceae bacterium]